MSTAMMEDNGLVAYTPEEFREIWEAEALHQHEKLWLHCMYSDLFVDDRGRLSWLRTRKVQLCVIRNYRSGYLDVAGKPRVYLLNYDYDVVDYDYLATNIAEAQNAGAYILFYSPEVEETRKPVDQWWRQDTYPYELDDDKEGSRYDEADS